MSFMIYQVKCDKCNKVVTTSFGIVGMAIIAEPIKDCKCGGQFEQVAEMTDPIGTLHKHNRIDKTQPRLGKYYCYSCDRALVPKGGRCPCCGKKDKSKRQKKQ